MSLGTPLGNSAAAAPIAAEAEVRVEDGNVTAARQSALHAALARAVGVVLERHVSSEDRQVREKELRAAFLSRPAAHILRYTVSSEDTGTESIRIRLEAEVDRQRVLAALTARGIEVHTLTTHPRVLLVPLGGASATPATLSLENVLEAEGVRARMFSGDVRSPFDEALIAEQALALGCHVAAVVTAETTRLAEREAEAPVGAEDRPTEARVAADAQGWLVDARSEQVLGRSEASAIGTGPDATAAGARGIATAGSRLAYALLADLEQSGWSAGDETRTMDLLVQDLTGPALVEDLQRELLSLAEVRWLELRELRYRSAVWRLETVETGLGWDAVLRTLRLTRGRLDWSGYGAPELDEGIGTVRAYWLPQ